MANGRFISNTLGASHKFGDLSNDTHRVMYVLIITHTDVEGRVDADPRVLNGRAFTLMGWTTDQVQAGLEALAAAKLIHLYRVGGRQYAEIVDFEKHNKVRKDREKASDIPARASNAAAPVQHERGSTPGGLPELAGSSPQQVEVQVQVQVQEEPRARARATGALEKPEKNPDKPKPPPKPKLGDFDPRQITLPEFLDPDVWRRYADFREELGKPLTKAGTKETLSDLAKHPLDADEMLRTAIKRTWTGVFPLDKPRDAPNDPAAQAWDKILASARNGKPPDLDPAGRAALKAIGGWTTVAYGDERGLGILRKRYLDAYRTPP